MLSPGELLAFAGLARLLIQADGRFSEDEAAALEAVAADLFAPDPVLRGGPYRAQAVEDEAAKPDAAALWNVMERSQELLPDEDAIRGAAKTVTRQEARDAIYGALFEIAASDVISKGEWPLLEWLEGEWNLTT